MRLELETSVWKKYAYIYIYMNRFRNRGIDREIIQERMVYIFIHVYTYIWIFLSMYSQWSWQPSSNEHTQTWDILVLNTIPLGKELGILIFDKGQTQKKNGTKIVFSTNGTETTGFPHAKKTKNLDVEFTLSQLTWNGLQI